MGLYAFFLAGSNYFAPVICGFINEYQGWKWVFYWPAIFLAVAFVFLFFFMEETNYVRKSVAIAEVSSTKSSDIRSPEFEKEKALDIIPETKVPEVVQEIDSSQVSQKKTFWQKLALKDKSKPNLMLYRGTLTMKFISWPVVFYAGYVFAQLSK